MSTKLQDTLTDVPGILVGHSEDLRGATGCTVVLCPEGAVAGVDQRGGAPGTRETDLLRPMHLVERVHAVLLSGGSAFGLQAAEGVVRYLEEQGVGFPTPWGRVPIVPAAVIFDLGIGDPRARPTAEMGYRACQAASREAVRQGNAGAGAGASVGKILGMEHATKAGIGSASMALGEVRVAALVVVNAFGDVVHPKNGQILAGPRVTFAAGQDTSPMQTFHSTLALMRQNAEGRAQIFGTVNTVIGVIATNARLNKEQANKVAQMAHDGLARAVVPAHTMYDGDTLFALSTGSHPCDISTLGACAAEVTHQAILKAVYEARTLANIPAARDLAGGEFPSAA